MDDFILDMTVSIYIFPTLTNMVELARTRPPSLFLLFLASCIISDRTRTKGNEIAGVSTWNNMRKIHSIEWKEKSLIALTFQILDLVKYTWNWGPPLFRPPTEQTTRWKPINYICKNQHEYHSVFVCKPDFLNAMSFRIPRSSFNLSVATWASLVFLCNTWQKWQKLKTIISRK